MAQFLYQKISSPLCIILISLMAFWTVLYYVTTKAQVVGRNLSFEQNTHTSNQIKNTKDTRTTPARTSTPAPTPTQKQPYKSR